MRLAAADSPLASLKPSDGRDGVASFGRDWTNLGILVSELIGAPLDRVSDLRLVPSEIAEHIVVEAFIRLMRVGWVELAPSAEGLTFVATEGGKTQIRSGILQAPTVTTPRWMSFLIDQVAGSVFRRTDIAVRHRNELSKIAENLVYLPKSPNHDREDLAELFAAMEGDDEVIVRVEPSPRRARAINPDLPVVYITGANADEWAVQGVPNSILLTKPFAPAQLVTAVSHLLNTGTQTA